MKSTNTQRHSAAKKKYFDFGKYLPWISDKKMFSAISFAHSLACEKKTPICTALSIAARYYEVDQTELASWYSKLVENIRAQQNCSLKTKQEAPKVESWQSKMTQLEAILLT